MSTLDIQRRLAEIRLYPGALDGVKGRMTVAAIKAFQEQNGLDADGVVGAKTLAALELDEPDADDVAETPAGRIFTAARLDDFAPHGRADILAALVAGEDEMVAAGIDTPLRLQHFLAQIHPETGGLQQMSESLNYSVAGLRATFGRHRISDEECDRVGRKAGQPANQVAIANIVYGGEFGRQQLGNTEPGDGWTYRGGGMAQTTGRANYRRAGHEDDPEVLREPATALTAALKFWTDNDLARFADRDDVEGMRRAWNGGRNGLDEARAALARAKRIFVTPTDTWEDDAREQLSALQAERAEIEAEVKAAAEEWEGEVREKREALEEQAALAAEALEDELRTKQRELAEQAKAAADRIAVLDQRIERIAAG